MLEIIIHDQDKDDLLSQLQHSLEGVLEEKWGESILTFDNHLGKGTIKSIPFDWGVTLFDYDVNFRDDTKLIHKTGAESPVEFIFISEGKLKYLQENSEEELVLERYQNVIISSRAKSKKTFVFPKKASIKVNFIHILKKEYAKKKNNNLSYLNEVLLSVFNDEAFRLPYQHLGNYNLKIADQVREMRLEKTDGIVRTLGIEGRLNIILAMQLMEQHKFESGAILPESLMASDIKKVHNMAEFILDNISEPITIALLTRESGLGAKKLQTGFKMLYGKTINEYVKTLKLEISRDYLKNTDHSISEIVYRVGIRSRSYFSKIFSEHYGLLPTEYRAKLKKKVSG